MYEMPRPIEGVDVVPFLGDFAKKKGQEHYKDYVKEQENAVPGGISPEGIKGAYEVKVKKQAFLRTKRTLNEARYIENLRYQGPQHPTATQILQTSKVVGGILTSIALAEDTLHVLESYAKSPEEGHRELKKTASGWACAITGAQAGGRA